MTLGLAEVEERLRALCRRLNAVTAQHTAYLGLSVVVLVVTALIILGLRATTSTFRIAAWGGAGLAIVAMTASVVFLRRQWLDMQATAYLVDRRAQLTDRLATLIDLRARPRPSRLAPLLVAQALALGAQWQPQRIVPRRVPRSVFLFVASLLALVSTALISRRAPSPAAPAVAGSGAGQVRSLDTSGPLEAPRLGAGASTAEQMAGSTNLQASADSQSDAAPPHSELAKGGTTSLNGGGELSGREPLQQPDASLGALPDRLREAIRRAFHPEAMDHPRELAARSEPKAGDAAQRDDGQGQGDTQRRGSSDGSTPASQKGTESTEKAGGKKQPGQSKGGQGGQRPDADAPNQNFDGAAPQAGDGSSPGGLLDAQAPGATAGQDGPKTFKLTITSFLRAVEQKGNQFRQPGKRTSGIASADPGSGAQTPLSDRQLSDDALRKAEIPPEYEDIVRRVYSSRADQ